ncbi:hypothetical protein X975_02503, partial [Stegodyphus mimosarum]
MPCCFYRSQMFILAMRMLYYKMFLPARPGIYMKLTMLISC